LRVLVVEDETVISMLLEECLYELGCEVTEVASQLKDAMVKALGLEIDAAVLDVNLGGELSYPVAQALRGRGVPIVFATGYGASGLPENLRDAPILAKPFRKAQLADALRRALEQSAKPPMVRLEER